MTNRKKQKWKKYAFEFLSIFIAVIAAFSLNGWKENRQSKHSEKKILEEINNGISLDLNDFNNNTSGYRLSLRANDVFKDLIHNRPVYQDSIALYYTALLRDFVPIINQSGYESLKAEGLKTVRNDSLRFKIITLYDYYYGILDKVEYEIDEMDSYDNYFQPINTVLHPYMEFDTIGNLIGIKQPITISENKKRELLSYLWRIDASKKFKINRYDSIIAQMLRLQESIKEELRTR